MVNEVRLQRGGKETATISELFRHPALDITHLVANPAAPTSQETSTTRPPTDQLHVYYQYLCYGSRLGLLPHHREGIEILRLVPFYLPLDRLGAGPPDLHKREHTEVDSAAAR